MPTTTTRLHMYHVSDRPDDISTPSFVQGKDSASVDVAHVAEIYSEATLDDDPEVFIVVDTKFGDVFKCSFIHPANYHKDQ